MCFVLFLSVKHLIVIYSLSIKVFFFVVKNSEDFQTDNVSKMLVTDANSHFTIVQIKELINEGAYQNRIYTCDAFVEILTSKPRIKSELWHLSAQINDHTDVLQVSFSNSVKTLYYVFLVILIKLIFEHSFLFF